MIGSGRVHFNVRYTGYTGICQRASKKQYRDNVFNENTYKIAITYAFSCMFHNVRSSSVDIVDVEMPVTSNSLSDSIFDVVLNLESDLELESLESELL